MKVLELCKTCKYVRMLSHGILCKKKVRARYIGGKLVCSKYRLAKRYQTQSLLG